MKTKNIYEKLEAYKKVSQKEKIFISSSKDAYNYIKDEFKGLKKEIVFFLALNTKNQILYKKLMFEGSLNYSIFDIRQIIKECLINDISAFMLFHNHPSGDETPSPEDIKSTEALKKATDLMNVRLLDHIIIGDNYYSLFDNDYI